MWMRSSSSACWADEAEESPLLARSCEGENVSYERSCRTAILRATHLAESLAVLLQVPRRKLQLSTQPRRLLLAKLELEVDNVLLATKVTNDLTKLIDRTVVTGGDGVNAGGIFEGFSVGSGGGRLTTLKLSGLRVESFKVSVEGGVLAREVLAAADTRIISQQSTR